MKCLTLFVHDSSREDVLDCLRAAPEVSGFTLTECQGHSTETGEDPFQGARDRVVGFVPRVRIEIVLSEEAARGVLERVRGCLASGGRSLGVYTLTDLREFGRF